MDLKSHSLIFRFHNQFRYGMSEIYKTYANIDHNKLLIGLFQHGVIQTRFMTSQESELDIKTPRHLFNRSRLYVFTKSTSEKLKELFGIKSYAIGSPWIYLENQAMNIPDFDTREKTIIFPVHTTPIDNFSYNEESITIRIKRWLEIVGGTSITICLYHSDYMDSSWHSAISKFSSKQVRLFCAGVSESPPWSLQDKSRINFLSMVKSEINKHEQALFETYDASALFYALDLGLKVGVFKSHLAFDAFLPETRINLSRYLQDTEKLIPEKFKNQLASRFNSNEYLKLVAREFLGYGNRLTPDGMKAQLVCSKLFKL